MSRTETDLRDGPRPPSEDPPPETDPPSPLETAPAWEPPSWSGRLFAAVAVAFPIFWCLFFLRHEPRFTRWDLNDGVLHLRAIERMEEAPAQGESPLDFWISEWTLGYPFFHTYQPLGHVLVALLHRAVPRSSTLGVFSTVRYLLVAFWPLIVYASARLLGLGRGASAAAALFSPFLSTSGNFGLEFGSYLWRGSGLYSQLVGQWFFPLALAASWRAARHGVGHGWAGLWIALTILSHLYYGWAALLLLGLAILLPSRDGERRIPARLSGAAVFLPVAFVAVAWFVVPMLTDARYANHSRWEYSYKWDSFGALTVLRLLLTGQLLDDARLPVITVLGGVGIATILLHRPLRRFTGLIFPAESEGSLGFILAGFLLCFLLFFGRTTWGPLFDLLPGASDLPHHRMLGPLHYFCLLLAGIGASAGASLLRLRRSLLGALTALGLLGALTIPVIVERTSYVRQGEEWAAENEAGIVAGKDEVEEVVRLLREDGVGRAFPGLAGGWGREFKIGMSPLYAFLSRSGIDTVAFLYHSMALTSEIMVQFDETCASDYDLFHVTHAVAPADREMAPFLSSWKEVGKMRIYRAPESHWFAPWTVDRWFVGDQEDFYGASLDWMRGEDPGAGRGLGLLFPGEPEPPHFTGAGALLSEDRHGQVFSATVDNDGATAWMLKQTFHPGWSVAVDGHRARTFMLAPGFLGIEVPAGRHEIVCRYDEGRRKRALLPPGGIALLGLLLLGLAGKGFPVRIESILHRPISALGEALLRIRTRIPPVSLDLLLALAIGALSGLPLLHDRMPSGHDVLEYLPRLVEFHENLRHGILLPRWAPDLGSGQGEPLFLFSPPVYYWIAEGFHLAGAPFVLALNLACILLSALSGLFACLLGRELACRFPHRDAVRFAGVATAALYALSPYLATDLYVRAAWAELAAFPWIPLALWGILRAARGGRGGELACALGIALLALSHNAIFLLSLPLLAAAVFLAAGEPPAPLTRLGALLRIGISCATGLLLSSFFLLPVLGEMKWTKVYLLQEGYLNYAGHFVLPHQLLWSKWGYGLSMPGPNDGMSFMAGPAQIAAALAAVVLLAAFGRGGRRERLFVPALGTLALFYFFLTTDGSDPLWRSFAFLRYMAFPWRALLPATVCLAALGGLAAAHLAGLPRARLLLAAFLLTVGAANLGHDRPERTTRPDLAEWTPAEIARRGISTTTKNEFQPAAATEPPGWTPDRATIVAGTGDAFSVRRDPEGETFDVHAAGPVTVEIATFDFPGWTVTSGGVRIAHRTAPGTGRIFFDLPGGESRVELRYRRTGIETAGRSLSAAGLGLLIALTVRPRMRAGRKDPPEESPGPR